MNACHLVIGTPQVDSRPTWCAGAHERPSPADRSGRRPEVGNTRLRCRKPESKLIVVNNKSLPNILSLDGRQWRGRLHKLAPSSGNTPVRGLVERGPLGRKPRPRTAQTVAFHKEVRWVVGGLRPTAKREQPSHRTPRPRSVAPMEAKPRLGPYRQHRHSSPHSWPNAAGDHYTKGDRLWRRRSPRWVRQVGQCRTQNALRRPTPVGDLSMLRRIPDAQELPRCSVRPSAKDPTTTAEHSAEVVGRRTLKAPVEVQGMCECVHAVSIGWQS